MKTSEIKLKLDILDNGFDSFYENYNNFCKNLIKNNSVTKKEIKALFYFYFFFYGLGFHLYKINENQEYKILEYVGKIKKNVLRRYYTIREDKKIPLVAFTGFGGDIKRFDNENKKIEIDFIDYLEAKNEEKSNGEILTLENKYNDEILTPDNLLRFLKEDIDILCNRNKLVEKYKIEEGETCITSWITQLTNSFLDIGWGIKMQNKLRNSIILGNKCYRKFKKMAENEAEYMNPNKVEDITQKLNEKKDTKSKSISQADKIKHYINTALELKAIPTSRQLENELYSYSSYSRLTNDIIFLSTLYNELEKRLNNKKLSEKNKDIIILLKNHIANKMKTNRKKEERKTGQVNKNKPDYDENIRNEIEKEFCEFQQ